MRHEHLRTPLLVARHAWPGVALTDAAFMTYLQRVRSETLTDPEQVSISDLYGACACANGDPQALALFRDRAGQWIAAAIARLSLGSGEAADVQARVIDALVFASPPKITFYDGRTTLQRWIAVIAVRTALNLKRERKRERPLSDSLLLERAADDDAELAYFRQLYAAEVKVAFASALAALPLRQRTMLRSHVLDDLTLQEVGALYGLHVSTVSRELATARADLQRLTRKALVKQLNVAARDADSIIRLLMSVLERSLKRLLAA